MFSLREIKGLKYPDEYLVRFFFKDKLFQRQGRVLELGCGNGNNLTLFYQYGWDVAGIDNDQISLAEAAGNFELIGEKRGGNTFIRHDLCRGLPQLDGKFEAVIMPNVLYYISREAMMRCLREVNTLLVPGGFFFVRMRTLGDYRYGKGRQAEANGFFLDIEETGEKGLLNVFYRPEELAEALHKSFPIDEPSFKIFNVMYDNIQNDVLIRKNSDVVLWGKVK